MCSRLKNESLRDVICVRCLFNAGYISSSSMISAISLSSNNFAGSIYLKIERFKSRSAIEDAVICTF